MKRKNDEVEINDNKKTTKSEKTPTTPAAALVPDSGVVEDGGGGVEKKNNNDDMAMLKKLKKKCIESSKAANHEIEQVQQMYYMGYFKNAIEKMPIAKDFLKDFDLKNETDYQKVYSIMKTCVVCDYKLKTTKSLCVMSKTISNIIGKAVHSKLITPLVKNFTGPNAADEAFHEYINYLSQEQVDEVQCLAYIAQEELEKKQALKIPNPVYACVNSQINAISKYVVHLLQSLAVKTMQKEDKAEVDAEVEETEMVVTGGERRRRRQFREIEEDER